MGRRKNQSSSSTSDSAATRFEDADHDESMCDHPDLDKAVLDVSMADEPAEVSNDKTSADYYFDSYSHFGKALIFIIGFWF